jgi:hypothetical protein
MVMLFAKANRPTGWEASLFTSLVTLQAFGQVDITGTKSVIKSKGAWHDTDNRVNNMVKQQRTPNHSAITMKMTLPKSYNSEAQHVGHPFQHRMVEFRVRVVRAPRRTYLRSPSGK